MWKGTLEKLYWVSGWIYEFSKVATIILFVGLLTHYFLFSFIIVRGRSMDPNFVDGNILLVNKIAYVVGKPQRGDVVGMFFPGEPQNRFIKRIVGLPGETVKIDSGKVYIDGKKLTEMYLDSSVSTYPNMERKLQVGEYFVFGDNRSVSSDSRAWGPVPRSFITGKVVTKVYTLSSEVDLNTN